MKPAIIILDKEGEYTNFASLSQMSAISRKYLSDNGVTPISPEIFTLNDDEKKADSTLSLRALEPKDIIYLIPELESKTENIFILLTDRVKDYFNSNGIPLEITSFRDRLLQETNNSNLIHIAQRPAIARAILSPALTLFDRKNKIPLIPGKLLQPGKISVINCQGLDRSKRRVVALYLQLMLDRFKMNSASSEPGVILIIDEAEELFSQSPHKSEKEFVTRIVGKMEDVVNRGRKHKFGVILVTHSPTALAASVADLTNTKVAFGCSGDGKWARTYFGKENVAEISELDTGKARIAVKIGNDKQPQLNLRFRVPYVGDAENLPKEANES